MIFRNRQRSEPLASFPRLFRRAFVKLSASVSQSLCQAFRVCFVKPLSSFPRPFRRAFVKLSAFVSQSLCQAFHVCFVEPLSSFPRPVRRAFGKLSTSVSQSINKFNFCQRCSYIVFILLYIEGVFLKPSWNFGRPRWYNYPKRSPTSLRDGSKRGKR